MKYLILGAGPAGLAFAHRLRQNGESSFLILEQESSAGGLCRSAEVDRAPFDIGGGHFLDVRIPEVNQFLFEFMPESEWIKYNRDSRIEINGVTINHPIEANIWQMKIEDQIEYLKSIAAAGCNLGIEKPELFVDWVYWKLGSKIADEYMIPYNQKVFGKELNQLGTYWLEKLPNVSFEETLASCLTKRAYGTQPGHAQFYYPKKYGYGEVWLRMADILRDRIEYNKAVCGIDFGDRTVTTSDNENYQADVIVSTIPWTEFKKINNMPREIENSIKELRYSSIVTEYIPKELPTNAHWIYYPDSGLSYHRILVRHNFCPGSRGYWTETNAERANAAESKGHVTYMNKYAYPFNTIDKPQIMKRLLKWSSQHKVYGLGRWGNHQHYNSDVTVGLAMKMADAFKTSDEERLYEY
ncbi:MAG: NAD(P)-binding protein [Hungatella sp.]|nr:NAD(P)-binding protein [Hungatella sp.]